MTLWHKGAERVLDAIHDMGGMQGFGPIEIETDEPVFHQRWQGRVFAMVGTLPNTDAFRHAVERMQPLEYLGDGYYGRWLASLETLFCEHGVIDRSEYEARVRALGGTRGAARTRPLEPAWPADVPAMEPHEGLRREMDTAPRFAVGEKVRALDLHADGHTRLPRYARGRHGVVDSLHGGWVYPDTHAHGQGAQPQHLYTVRFAARELWGEQAAPNHEVFLDLFEPYLETDRDA